MSADRRLLRGILFALTLVYGAWVNSPGPAFGQVSQLSNPPGLTTAAIAGKANLAGGNSFTGGDQDILGGFRLHLQDNPITSNWYLQDNAGNLSINSPQNFAVSIITNSAQVANFSSTGLSVTGTVTASGAYLSGATTVINGSGVLQAAAFPALTGDVTNTAGSLGTTISANAVTYAKMQSVTAARLLGNPTGAGAVPSEISLAGGLGFSGTTLTAAGALTPTSVASTGAISGTTVAASSSILSSGTTNGIGYSTGAGGAVTQLTSRVTGVTNNKACGAITMFSAAGSATWATFVVTDSAVAATDVIDTSVKSATNLYILSVTGVGSGTFNLSFATTGGTATDAPVINYCVIKGVAA